jgi:UDP-N-acetylmuramyl tripeptide synthase
MPGAIARKICPPALPLLFEQARQGVILVVGTNGKTTTSLLLKKILEKGGFQVAHNGTGANLINGLTTALIEHTNAWGRLQADYSILEVDENILPLLLKDCTPQYIIILNLFRDQLDRYGEVDTISRKWQDAIGKLPPETVIVTAADDPSLCFLGQNLQQLQQKVLFFGLNEPDLFLPELPHAVDSIYCPSCGDRLVYDGVYLSHLGDFRCPSCDFARSGLSIDSQEWPQILIGVYNKYNTLAASLAALAMGIDRETIKQSINTFQAAFGRAEQLVIEGKKIRILLSKNPVGMNETIRAIAGLHQDQGPSTVLLCLNDRIADGTDVSWIWDVDTEAIVAAGFKLVVTGDRLYDMALRLQYSQADNPDLPIIAEPDLATAIDQALAHTAIDQTLYIVPTYTAMLEVREVLTGKKIPTPSPA